ncbi:iron ABC transporter permease, partial [Streptomyces sp. SID7982]|nr:iron ABC transporter permease [Streptomyces sp. SID7982]
EVEIYRQTAQLLDLPTAAVLTLVQFAAVGGILAVHAATVRRRERALKLVDPAQTSRRPRGAGQRALLGGVLLTALLLILLPLGVLVERSLDGADGPGGYGFGYYEALQSAGAGGSSTFLVPPLEAVGNS